MATPQGSTRKTAPKKAPVKKPAAASGAKATLRKKAPGAAASGPGESPILPVDQLKQLHQIKPGAVDWVINQTQIEAEHRREETSRVNGFILVEHFLGQVSALTLGVTGILGGSYVAINGQPWAGVAIAASVMAGLTFVYLAGAKKR